MIHYIYLPHFMYGDYVTVCPLLILIIPEWNDPCLRLSRLGCEWLMRALTQRGRWRHPARVAGRGAARARRRRVPAAGRRALRQLAAGDRQGNVAQAHQRRRRRGRGHCRRGRVDPVHARGGGARRRRARAGRHARPRVQRRRRSHGARLGPGGRRRGVARLVRWRRERAVCAGSASARAAGRSWARRAPLRHAHAHAHRHALVVGRDGPAAGGARRGRRGGCVGARAGGRPPPLHRRGGQDTALGPAHVGMRVQGVVGAHGGGDVPGGGGGRARGPGGHRLQGPLRAHPGHATAGHRRVGRQRPAAAGAAALRRRAGARAGARRAVQRLARHQPQALGPRREHAHTQRDERAQGVGDGRVRDGRGERGVRGVVRARRGAARVEPGAAPRRAARAPARRGARARRAPAPLRTTALHSRQRRRRSRLATHGAVNQRRPHKMLAHPQGEVTVGGGRECAGAGARVAAPRLAVTTRASTYLTRTQSVATTTGKDAKRYKARAEESQSVVI